MFLGDQYFTAVLRSPMGELLAEGWARISVKRRSVEFRSDFVPLLLLGEKAEVCRVVDGQETHRFQGEVYLSSPDLLRLVQVDERLLAALQLEALQLVELHGTVSPSQEGKGLLARIHKPPEYPAEVAAISLRKLRLFSIQPFEMGARLEFSCSEPISLQRVELRVDQLLEFGSARTGFRCEICNLSEENRRQLIDYLAQREREAAEDGDEWLRL